jgi:hypothetical protein
MIGLTMTKSSVIHSIVIPFVNSGVKLSEISYSVDPKARCHRQLVIKREITLPSQS